MAEVECIGHRRHDLQDVLFRHAARVGLPNQPTGVCAVHVVHRDPESAVVLATIENTDDMGVPQRGGQFRLANDSRPELPVNRGGPGQDLEGVVTR